MLGLLGRLCSLRLNESNHQFSLEFCFYLSSVASSKVLKLSSGILCKILATNGSFLVK
jgi:hypothetical protein